MLEIAVASETCKYKLLLKWVYNSGIELENLFKNIIFKTDIVLLYVKKGNHNLGADCLYIAKNSRSLLISVESSKSAESIFESMEFGSRILYLQLSYYSVRQNSSICMNGIMNFATYRIATNTNSNTSSLPQ